MFNKKYFLFYLPKLNKFKIVKSRDESEAVWKLVNYYKSREEDLTGYRFIRNIHIIK